MSRGVIPLAVLCSAGFFLLFGYTAVRSATPTLFIADFGAENLPVALTFVVVAVFAAVYIYGQLLSFFGPAKTFALTSLLNRHYFIRELFWSTSWCHLGFSRGSHI